MKEAKGTYIKILDADDTFETENFAKFINYIEKWNGVDLFFSDFCMVTQKGKIKRKISYSFDSKESNPFESLLKKMNDTEYMHAVTYETENLRKINYFQTEGISYTDQEWVFLPMSVVKTFSYFPKTVYKYTVGRDGQTVSPRSYAKNMWMEIKCVKVMIKEYENGKTVFAKENLTYLTRQITFWTCHLYKLFLFIFPGLLNIRDLWEFDSWLKENSPFLYEETEKLKSSKKFFSFYFIKDFRHGKNINFMIWNSLKPLRFMYRVMRKVIKERTTEKTKSPSSKVAIQ